MKKEELRHDPIRDRIIMAIEKIAENKSVVGIALLSAVVIISIFGFYNYKNTNLNYKSSQLAGVAQSSYINNITKGDELKLNESIVKFNRVLEQYPQTNGAIQSLVYLINHALQNDDYKELERLISDIDLSTDDEIIISSLYKIKGDFEFYKKNYLKSIEFYNKAINSNSNNDKYKLSLAQAYISSGNFNDAIYLLDEIINKKNINFQTKSTAEELKYFSKHKNNI